MRIPDPKANTTTEAYLAYKAGFLEESELKPSLYEPYLHFDAWLAYWAGLTNTYPLDKNGDPEMLTDEEALVAYLSGVTNTYPEEIKDPYDVRIVGYLKYLVSARWGRPEYPVNNEEFYLSTMKPPVVPSGDPSTSIELDGTVEAPFIDLKMYGDSEQRNLPKGYTQVLGIRAGGASYIDIATTIGTDDSFEYSYSISIENSSTQWGYRGAERYDSANSFSGTYTGGGRLIVYANSSSAVTNTQTTEPFAINTRLDFKYDGDTRTASALGYTFTKSSGFAPDVEPPQNHFVLNGIYITSTNKYQASSTGNIIYRFKSAECDIYPCVRDSDGKVGLYDVKRNIFIPPTAGTFTVVTGKNLLPLTGFDYSSGGLTSTNNGSTVRISGTTTTEYATITGRTALGATIPSGTDITLSMTSALPAGVRLFMRIYGAEGSSYSNLAIADGETSISTTLGRDFGRYMFLIYSTVGTTLNISNLGIQIETGSTATSFEPYVGGTPSPNPDYPQAVNTVTGEQMVKVNGKNLSPNITGYTLGTNGGAEYETTDDSIIVSTGSTGTSTNKGIYVNKATNGNYCPEAYMIGYTVSFTVVASAETYFLYHNESQAKNYTTIGTTPMRLSFPSGTGNMVFYAKEQNITFTLSDFQVESGSTATEFSPYVQLHTVNLGSTELCKIGSYQDYIYRDEDGDWYVHKETGKLVFDGSENWFIQNSKTENFYYAKSNLSLGFTANTQNLMSNYGVPGLISNANTERGIIIVSVNGNQLRIRYGSEMDIDDWKRKLSVINLELYYAAPSSTDNLITNSELISQIDALMEGGSYEGKTYIKVTATEPNLPGLLYVEAGKYD